MSPGDDRRGTPASAGVVDRHFVGVGIDVYEHFGPLKMLEVVREIAALLTEVHGFEAVVLDDLCGPDADGRVKAALPYDQRTGCGLIVLWAGHGEVAQEGQLRLITRSDEPSDSPMHTAEWLASRAVRSGARQVLLVLDTCFSGEGIPSAGGVAARLKANLPDSKPAWIGILASARAYERARDDVFLPELKRVLSEGPRDPILRLRFNAYNAGVRGDDVIDAVVQEWPPDGQQPEAATFGRPGILLPNPLYNPDEPERVVEHLLLAAAGRAPDEEGVFFTGRDAQLAQIVAWMGQPDPGVLVITGPAGSGKSAIAGRIVSLSSPATRSALMADAGARAHDPGERSVAAHVHARRLTVDRVAAMIDEQLRAKDLLPAAAEARSHHELLGALQRVNKVFTIVIDGVDEADQDAWPIAEDLIRGLGRLARVLVATRDVQRDNGESLVATVATVPPIDLGDPRWVAQTEEDIKAYVIRRLRSVEGGNT